MTAQYLRLTWYNKDKVLIPIETGKYGYRWVDPSDPRYCETHTLIYDDFVCGEQTPKSDDFEYSRRADFKPQVDNLLIQGESGDVLETLTRVPELVEKYVGRVKLVYIDPPFNTAQTFASYEDNLEHSIWLTMMRDRLLNLKKLLSDDGSIWVHLDYSENHRMRLLLDEVFGASNFVAEFVWQKADSPRGDAQRVSVDQDVILCYAASDSTQFNRMDRTAIDNARFSNPDRDENGMWWADNRTAPHSIDSHGLQVPAVYAITHPVTGKHIYPAVGRQWAFKKQRILKSLNEYTKFIEVKPDLQERSTQMDIPQNSLRSDVPDLAPVDLKKSALETRERIAKGNWPEFFVTESSFGRKSYPPVQGQPPRTWWSNDQVGHNRTAKSEIKALFPGSTPFSTPKPERLLERIIHIGSNPGDIVLDIFAGSGTTAAVAQKMGRRWVTCELLDSTFKTFTRPRLEKVVRDQDPGGVTCTKGERVAADGTELPEGVSPEEAAKFSNVLNKLIADDPEAKKSPSVKAMKRATKTKRSRDTVNWRGGGGFQVAHLSPACFDYDPKLKRVMLTDAATGQTLIDSVAANLGFALLNPEDDYIFDARRGNTLLKVIEGAATTQIIDWLSEQVEAGETIVLAATSVLDGTRQHLRHRVKGSRIIAIPDDLFHYRGSSYQE